MEEVISEVVRPMLQADGGDIEVVEVDSQNNVKVRLKGQCVNCAGSAMTLSFAVEHQIKDRVPEIQAVLQVP